MIIKAKKLMLSYAEALDRLSMGLSGRCFLGEKTKNIFPWG